MGFDGLVPALGNIMATPFDQHVDPKIMVTAKANAMILISSCLEGRPDLQIQDLLAPDVEPKELMDFRTKMNRIVREIIKQKELVLAGKEKDGSLPAALEDEEVMEVALDSLSAVDFVLKELKKVPEFLAKAEVAENKIAKGKLADGAPAAGVGATWHGKEDSGDHDVQFRDVEIRWLNRIELVSYPVPKFCRYFTLKTKLEFFQTVDLSTQEKRMKQLVASYPLFQAEMEHIYSLAHFSPTYRFIARNIASIKWAMYLVLVMLNVNIFMATYAPGNSRGYASISTGTSLKGPPPPPPPRPQPIHLEISSSLYLQLCKQVCSSPFTSTVSSFR